MWGGVCVSPIEAVNPEVSRATIWGAQVGTGRASFSDRMPHSEKAPYTISATQSPTCSPADRTGFSGCTSQEKPEEVRCKNHVCVTS